MLLSHLSPQRESELSPNERHHSGSQTALLSDADPETEAEVEANEGHDLRFASTYFYSKLMEGETEYNYKNVKRWTKDVDIFECDKIIIPINVSRPPHEALRIHPHYPLSLLQRGRAAWVIGALVAALLIPSHCSHFSSTFSRETRGLRCCLVSKEQETAQDKSARAQGLLVHPWLLLYQPLLFHISPRASDFVDEYACMAAC